jgi:hypothetical protein
VVRAVRNQPGGEVAANYLQTHHDFVNDYNHVYTEAGRADEATGKQLNFENYYTDQNPNGLTRNDVIDLSLAMNANKGYAQTMRPDAYRISQEDNAARKAAAAAGVTPVPQNFHRRTPAPGEISSGSQALLMEATRRA